MYSGLNTILWHMLQHTAYIFKKWCRRIFLDRSFSTWGYQGSTHWVKQTCDIVFREFSMLIFIQIWCDIFIPTLMCGYSKFYYNNLTSTSNIHQQIWHVFRSWQPWYIKIFRNSNAWYQHIITSHQGSYLLWSSSTVALWSVKIHWCYFCKLWWNITTYRSNITGCKSLGVNPSKHIIESRCSDPLTNSFADAKQWCRNLITIQLLCRIGAESVIKHTKSPPYVTI